MRRLLVTVKEMDVAMARLEKGPTEAETPVEVFALKHVLPLPPLPA